MNKLEEAREILKAVKSPKTNDLACNLLLALACISKNEKWKNATNDMYTTRELMDFMKDKYGIEYKANTRETVRKNVLHYFLLDAIVESNRDNPGRATNSPKFCYSITNEFLNLIRVYGTDEWLNKLSKYNDNVENLITKYKKEREFNMIPLKVGNKKLKFSPGKHNELQKSIIEEFAPRFAKGAELLYVGDTKNKDLVENTDRLKEIGITITEHDKLPDVILYLKEKNWLYFIEAVTSVGPMNDKRIIQIEELTKDCNCGNIYITAFLDKQTFKKFISELAWETEVWLADQPDHMIHLNGDKFMGPR